MGRIGLRSGGVVSPEETPGVIAAASRRDRGGGPRASAQHCVLSTAHKSLALTSTEVTTKRAALSPCAATPELPGRLDDVLHARSPRA